MHCIFYYPRTPIQLVRCAAASELTPGTFARQQKTARDTSLPPVDRVRVSFALFRFWELGSDLQSSTSTAPSSSSSSTSSSSSSSGITTELRYVICGNLLGNYILISVASRLNEARETKERGQIPARWKPRA